ncbi:tRNA:m(4)X modification enzyme TRM13 [Thoreauomyces humboldtii]|nr:tRNA:m(4)X modification enzyme TRM13 [Thoreauomyces humboldtii]
MIPGSKYLFIGYIGSRKSLTFLSSNVAARSLAKHLLKCNDKPQPIPPHFSLNCNVARPKAPDGNGPSAEEQKPARERMFAAPREDFMKLVQKIRRLHKDLPDEGRLEMQVLTHPAMQERLEKSANGKHAVQQSSLLGHIERLGLLKQQYVFAEFGAGKGELAKWIFVAVGDPSKYVLIDRRNFRQKFDAIMKHSAETWTDRLSLDIKDLDLSKFPRIKDQSIVAVSKHLCGSASDLTLRCIANFQKNAPANAGSAKIEGVVIALCCHHICSYDMFCDPAYLEELSIDKEEFEYLCVMTSWGTCGSWEQRKEAETGSAAARGTEEQKSEGKDGKDDDKDDTNRLNAQDIEAEGQQEHWTGMPFAERETLGLQCKRLLNHGRLAYLRRCGFDAELVHYVDRKYSLENVAIVAKQKVVVP